MVDNFCTYLVERIKKQSPDMDEEKALVIDFGVRLLIGELPKIFLLFIIGFLLGIGWYTLLGFFILLPFRSASGGFHMKTHIGCILCTIALYCGSALLASITQFEPIYLKYILIICTWIFGLVMIKIYAPADTENIPIISTKERKKKKIISYVTLTVILILAAIIPDKILSTMLIYEVIFQTISITKIAYKITNNKYGYQIYEAENDVPN